MPAAAARPPRRRAQRQAARPTAHCRRRRRGSGSNDRPAEGKLTIGIDLPLTGEQPISLGRQRD
eukprot:1063079-Alexandrium_andersonii.AAC.1